MHRNRLAVLVAFLALAGCKKSPPALVEVRVPEAPLRTASVAPAGAVHDAGVVALQVVPVALPVLGLAHVDKGAQDHLARARALKDEGDTLESLAEARRQLADSPEDDDALELVARAAQSLGQNALAAAAFEKLAAVRDDDAVPLVQAARMHLALNDAPGAERLASEALGRDGGNVEAYQALGRAALVQGDLRKAMDYLEQARVLAPSHGWVLNNLGFAYLRANENVEAQETLARAAELLPAAAVVQNNLGVALERLGRTEEATAAFEKSSALAPHYTRALVNQARLALLRTTDAGAAPTPEEDEEPGSDTDAAHESSP
jgi:tetratricopeptide (TPR) repeat protein